MSGSDTIELTRVRQPDKGLSPSDRKARYLTEADWPRPDSPAPAASAPLDVRERWSEQFVPWFFTQTGGEPENPDGGPAGQRGSVLGSAAAVEGAHSVRATSEQASNE